MGTRCTASHTVLPGRVWQSSPSPTFNISYVVTNVSGFTTTEVANEGLE